LIKIAKTFSLDDAAYARRLVTAQQELKDDSAVWVAPPAAILVAPAIGAEHHVSTGSARVVIYRVMASVIRNLLCRVAAS
jgi:hypothetical protein